MHGNIESELEGYFILVFFFFNSSLFEFHVFVRRTVSFS